MANIFGLNNVQNPTIRTDAKVLKSADYERLLEARALLAAAEERANLVIEEAHKEASRILEEARSKATVEADEALARQLLAGRIRAFDKLAEAETEMVSLVQLTIERLFGELSQEEAILAMIQSGMASLKDNYRVTIRVAPGNEARVQQSLPILHQSQPSVNYIEVKSDLSIAPDAYLLEGDGSIIKGSLSDQLVRLREVIAVALESDQ